MSFLRRWFHRLFLDHWYAIDREAAESPQKGGYDWAPVIVLITVAVSLTLQEYYGQRSDYSRFFPPDGYDRYYDLKGFAWWTGCRFGGYLVLPMLVIFAWRGQRIRDYYIGLRGFIKHLWIYVVLFLLILPAVFMASKSPAFYRTYPFYKWANRSITELLIWESMYALQFLSLEFFFRGFILQGLRNSMGSKAIFVMIVPYCMIHFGGKPVPETLGAIGAGIVLGTLAMRTRSIWGGVLIHVGVAVTMDLLALQQCPPGDSNLPCRGHR